MAPTVNLSDDLERVSQVVSQLARMVWTGRPLGQLEKPAAAAGLSAEQAWAFWRGEVILPSRQSVALVSAVLEQLRVQQVSYMTQLRQGHAGSNIMGASYAGKTIDKVTLPRGRTEERVSVHGGPLETSSDDAEASLRRLQKDFPGWRFDADGIESLGGDRPKVTWRGRYADGREVSGATSLEVAELAQRIEDGLAEDDRRAREYARR